MTKKGYKQSPEHIAKRIRTGEKHHSWIGDNVSVKGGRTRAYRMYKEITPCVLCASYRSERHHIDGNTANNEPENIICVCRKCHMKHDGRLEKFKEMAVANSKGLILKAAESKRLKKACHNGHLFDEQNTYINPSGARVCIRCRTEYKRAWRNKNGSKGYPVGFKLLFKQITNRNNISMVKKI